MKMAGEILNELGFSKNSSNETNESFLKHLIKATLNIHIQTPSEKDQIKQAQNIIEINAIKNELVENDFHQLCFDLENCS